MNRSDIVNKLLSIHPEMRRKQVDFLVKHLFDEMAQKLLADGRIEIRDFGCFSVRQRRAPINSFSKTKKLKKKRLIFIKTIYFRATKAFKSRLMCAI